MFDSLEDRIRHDNTVEVSRRERIMKGLAISLLTILLFGGLYYAVRMTGN